MHVALVDCGVGLLMGFLYIRIILPLFLKCGSNFVIQVKENILRSLVGRGVYTRSECQIGDYGAD